MDSQECFFLFLESFTEILIESLEVVDSRTAVDFLCIGGDERRLDFLAPEQFLEILINDCRIETRHSKCEQLLLIINSIFSNR